MSHIRRVNLCYHPNKHSVVHLALANHTESSDAAYLRKCIEFYELHQGGGTGQRHIIERLDRIEALLRNGVALAVPPGQGDTAGDITDDILDEALEQLE